MGRLLSAVDIGSNTVHLLVAEADAEGVRKVAENSEWLGLGEAVGRKGEISTAEADAVIKTLTSYKRISKTAKAEGWYVFGTEALRKAKNSKALIRRLKSEVGIDIDLITSDREAELGLRGTLIDCGGAESSLFVEVGGGSAQVAEVSADRLVSDRSLAIGTGALMARLDLDYPCSPHKVDALRSVVGEALEGALVSFNPEQMVVSGGVGRGLWRALHPDGDRMLHREELDYLIWATPRLTTTQIIERFRVKARRASTLLPGAIIFRSIMEAYKMDEMLISRFGVREGAILGMVEGSIKSCPL